MKKTKYKVNEIFYSIQAEGKNAGSPAIFVRLAGCNLDCSFCDTDHEPYVEMTRRQLESEVNKLSKQAAKGFAPIVVFTGGEPTLQLRDDEELCRGYYRAMETNGLLPAPVWIDYVAVSPKTKKSIDIDRANEIKVLYGLFDDGTLENLGNMANLIGIDCYLQPAADENGHFDVTPAVEFCKKHPVWKLSLQWHKLFNIKS